MELQTIRPNLVQAIRAYRVDDLMSSADAAGQLFLYANLSSAQSKSASRFLPKCAGKVKAAAMPSSTSCLD